MFRICHRCLDASKAWYFIYLVLVVTIFTYIIHNTIPYRGHSVFSKDGISDAYLNVTKNILATLQSHPQVMGNKAKNKDGVSESKRTNAVPGDIHFHASKSSNKTAVTISKNNLQNYQTSNSTSDQKLYKIEMEEDTGSDFQYIPIEYSFTLLKETLEETHKAALQYLRKYNLTTKVPNTVRYRNYKAHSSVKEYETSVTTINPEVKTEVSQGHKYARSQMNSEENIKQNIGKPEDTYQSRIFIPGDNTFLIRTMMHPCNCVRELQSNLQLNPPTNATEKQILQRINATFGDSTCNDWVTMRGYHQKVISFSLFGKFLNEYYNNTPSIIKQISSAYPGWFIRIYHDMNLERKEQEQWMCSLICKYPNVDFCHVKNLTGGLGDLSWTIGSIWRVSVLGDPLVTQFLIRDMDSPLLQREIAAVNDWLESRKCFHFMRDNPMHDQPIMAGMWGGCNSFYPDAMPRLRNTVFKWSNKSTSHHSSDQLNLSWLLWPTFKKNHTSHDAYSCLEYPESRPFPTRRLNFTFIGMRTARNEFAQDKINKPCPVQCRPANHKDWTFC
ncbi:uncharacterized protein LOC135226463 [Macrobrachium nipponense]|uniref:uncharacterized protein LOC135226463 n=1 Tax=Macrobrachium nipponense TaxID=159736 RepID=UPI0030C7E7ED